MNRSELHQQTANILGPGWPIFDLRVIRNPAISTFTGLQGPFPFRRRRRPFFGPASYDKRTREGGEMWKCPPVFIGEHFLFRRGVTDRMRGAQIAGGRAFSGLENEMPPLRRRHFDSEGACSPG